MYGPYFHIPPLLNAFIKLFSYFLFLLFLSTSLVLGCLLSCHLPHPIFLYPFCLYSLSFPFCMVFSLFYSFHTYIYINQKKIYFVSISVTTLTVKKHVFSLFPVPFMYVLLCCNQYYYFLCICRIYLHTITNYFSHVHISHSYFLDIYMLIVNIG